ncbi:DNA polymerase zeta catalytic subunit-like isoform X2 [Ornithodoros turicata]|uniref:DNA polymerase zeta catalytic subunit-like isoform X2 n=1 Tax=Ornithodoros turicata TaxID=34597 RepID=UPI003139F4C8
MFSLRIVTVDHYLAPPVYPLDPQFSKFRGNEVWQVPVLRVFGVTPGGQKACLHVHGIFPYLCIPYDDDENGGLPVERFSRLLALDLDKLLNAAAGKSSSTHQHVYSIEAFQAMQLYGFHNKEKTFLRIYFYNPFTVKRAAELLLSGMVLKRIMQPHEAHIPYILQFLVDHNLHGMNMLNVNNFKFRHVSPTLLKRESWPLQEAELWRLQDQPLASFLDPKIEKQSVCELELDCCGQDILNSKHNDGAMNPGLAAIWQDERERRQELGEASLTMPSSLDRDHVTRSDSELFYLRKLDRLLQSACASTSRSQLDVAHFSYHEPKDLAAARDITDSVDTVTSVSEILDSQDMSLVDMLARATANQSMAENPAEDIDSVLSSVPASQVQDDGSEDDDDDVMTREMSQVFDSESMLEAEQPAENQPLPGADSFNHAQSGWDESDEIVRLPCQLDGTDDDLEAIRSKKETPLMTDNEEAGDVCEGDLNWKPPPLLSRRLLSVPGDDLIGDDSESSCTDSEVNNIVQTKPCSRIDRPVDSSDPEARDTSHKVNPVPTRRHSRTTKLSLTLRKRKACSESSESQNTSEPPKSSGTTTADSPCPQPPSDMAGQAYVTKSGSSSELSISTAGSQSDKRRTFKDLSREKQTDEGETKFRNVRKSSKRTAHDANLGTPTFQSARKKRKTDVQSPKDETGRRHHERSKTFSFWECTVVLTQLSETCIKRWTQPRPVKSRQKQPAGTNKEKRVKGTRKRRNHRGKEDPQNNHRSKNDGQTRPEHHDDMCVSSDEAFHENGKGPVINLGCSDSDSIDLPKVIIEISSEEDLASKRRETNKICVTNAEKVNDVGERRSVSSPVDLQPNATFTKDSVEVNNVIQEKVTGRSSGKRQNKKSRTKEHVATNTTAPEPNVHGNSVNAKEIESRCMSPSVHMRKQSKSVTHDAGSINKHPKSLKREPRKVKKECDSPVQKASGTVDKCRNKSPTPKQLARRVVKSQTCTRETRRVVAESSTNGRTATKYRKKGERTSEAAKNRKYVKSSSSSSANIVESSASRTFSLDRDECDRALRFAESMCTSDVPLKLSGSQSSAVILGNDACSSSSSLGLDARVWNLEYVPGDNPDSSSEVPLTWSSATEDNELGKNKTVELPTKTVPTLDLPCSAAASQIEVQQANDRVSGRSRKPSTQRKSKAKTRKGRATKSQSGVPSALHPDPSSSLSTQQCDPNELGGSSYAQCSSQSQLSGSSSSQAIFQSLPSVPSSGTDTSVFKNSQVEPDVGIFTQDSSRSLFSGSSCVTSQPSQGSSKIGSQPVVAHSESNCSQTNTAGTACKHEQASDDDNDDDNIIGFDSEQHWVIVDEVEDSETGVKGHSSPDLFASQGQALSDASIPNSPSGTDRAGDAEDSCKTLDDADLTNFDLTPINTRSQVEQQSVVEQTNNEGSDVISQNFTKKGGEEKPEEETRRDVAFQKDAPRNVACSLDFTVASQYDTGLMNELASMESKWSACSIEFVNVENGQGMDNQTCKERALDICSDSLDFTQLQSSEKMAENGDQHVHVPKSPPSSTGFECCLIDIASSVEETGTLRQNSQQDAPEEKRGTSSIVDNLRDSASEATNMQNVEGDVTVVSSSVQEELDCGSRVISNSSEDSVKCCELSKGSEEAPALVLCESPSAEMMQQSATFHDVEGECVSATTLGSSNAEAEKCAGCSQDVKVVSQEDANNIAPEVNCNIDISLGSSELSSSTIQANETENTIGIHSFYVNTTVLGDDLDADHCSKSQEENVPPAVRKDGLFAMTPSIRPPSFEEVESSLETYGLPSCVPLDPFCSRSADGPIKASLITDETKGNPLDIFNHRKNGTLRADLPAWQQQIVSEYAEIKGIKVDFVKHPEDKATFCRNRVVVLTPVALPPSCKVVERWIAESNRKAGNTEAKQKVSAECEAWSELSQNSEREDWDVKQSTPLSVVKSLKHVAAEDAFRKQLQAKKGHTFSQERDGASSLTSSSLSCDLSPVASCSRGRINRMVEQDSPSSSKSSERTAVLTCPKTSRRSSLSTSTSQLEGPTRSGLFNFKLSRDCKRAKNAAQMLTVMSAELHIRTRSALRPDPSHDPVLCIFYCLYNDFPSTPAVADHPREITGAIVVGPSSLSPSRDKMCENHQGGLPDIEDLLTSADLTSPAAGASGAAHNPHNQHSQGRNVFWSSGVIGLKDIHHVADEKELYEALIEVVRKWDPDILVGYEIQMLSWGYLLQRASCLGMDLHQGLSRTPTEPKQTSVSSSSQEEQVDTHVEDVTVAGRVVLNIWRVMRKELTLNIYTFENVYFHVMHQRIPLYAFETLTKWFDHGTHLYRWRVIEHYVTRACGNIKLLNRLDVIGKTSEMARIFGILFFEVLSRGSQFRVESMMLRSARQRGMVAVSPSIQQRARMRAPEWIPLVMEPCSQLYTSPVLVLDFQSLYPSIMIAYNYCFSTCIGRVDCLGSEEPFVFGCSSLSVGTSLLNVIRKYITVSPGGVAFVLPPVRKGVLPQMLEEILSTRIMVKQAMKECKSNPALTRVLDARQLGLKLIANVTYGYTAASYSGRMPCVEVADSIVSKGRETLERAIKTVEETARWGAKVVYGDTDSMFVLLEGKTKRQAFEIGQEIAEVVTAQNPKPVKLKFEKVYLPCVLQTKKRYVGFAYESLEQLVPVYDAKGIETVRRDGCPAVSKILEKSLRTLFQSRDVSAVKHYVRKQFTKILSGKVNMQDFIFAKEYRGLGGYKPGACVPALEITRQLLRKDPRAEPRVGERVPYVVVYGSPGMRLIQLVRHVQHALFDPTLRLNSHYYITRAIAPALNRVFNLLGTDVLKWYSELPRQVESVTTGSKGSICHYLVPQVCPACKSQTAKGEVLCSSCKDFPQYPAIVLGNRVRTVQKAFDDICQICSSCMGFVDTNVCVSLDCPVLYRSVRADRDVQESLTWKDVTALLQKSTKTATG